VKWSVMEKKRSTSARAQEMDSTSDEEQ
jgi:hypothetical protein